MKIGVFISWSGDLSRKIAEKIYEWLPLMLNSVNPYFSPEDIKKGTVWNTELTKSLGELKIGIMILTPNNLESNWIMYEAGALAKGLDNTKVAPILFNVKKSEVKSPLSQFQLTVFTKNEFMQVLKMINTELEDEAVPEKRFDKSFEKWFPELEKEINEILENEPTSIEKENQRSDRDILEELLSLTREISSAVLWSQSDPRKLRRYYETKLLQLLKGDNIDSGYEINLPLEKKKKRGT